MSKIIITGSEGFVGRYVTQKFLQEGHEVVGIDNLSKYGKVFNEHPKYRCRVHNLCHPSTSELIKNLRGDIIIDLAEDVGGINYLNKNALDKLQSSMTIRYNVLKGSGNARYVCISSSCVYERVNTFPTPEIDLVDLPMPLSPYALSKVNAEIMAYQSGGNVVVVRLFNVAGKGDDHPTKSHVIADLVRKFKNCDGKPVTIVGSGRQTRNFTHGEDVAQAIYIIATNSLTGLVYNIGSYNTISIWDLAVKIAEKVGINSGIQPTYNPLYNINRSEPNWSKLFFTGYEPQWDIDRILDEAVEYYE